MTITTTLEFDIPPELERALRDGKFALEPARDFISRSTLQMFAKAVENAPVGVAGGGGGLRGSIDTEFEDNGLTGVVGSDLNYAPHVEFGTRPHWPPWREGSPLARWAQLRGIPAFLVARKIAARGTPAQKWMERAVTHTRDNVIPDELTRLGRDIQAEWVKLG